MIKVRLNALSEGVEIERKESETLKELVTRVLENNGHATVEENILEHMTVLINGNQIDREFWHIVQYRESDEVMVATLLKGGSFGQIFKQVAILAVVIVASILLNPGAGATLGASLTAAFEVAAITIGTTLLLNSLIPPPNLGNGLGIGAAAGSSLEASQMYSITSQSNNVNKFGHVPKVYGTHKMFPTVAANPYTEIETDPSTGNLVQFFYCIYDFGHGPLEIKNLKLGDTPISNYADVSYSLVDFNKPSVSEGPWDDAVTNVLNFYKGDLQQDNTSVAIDGNRDAGSDISDYQIIRNSSPTDGSDYQEIILDFICPKGLISYGTNGDSFEVNIDLEIFFADVGTSNWRAYNDPTWVKNYSYAGGSSAFSSQPMDFLPLTLAPLNYAQISLIIDTRWNEGSDDMLYVSTTKYGYNAGEINVTLGTGQASVGDIIQFNGIDLGTVVSLLNVGGGYTEYHLDKGFPTSVHMFTVTGFSDGRDPIIENSGQHFYKKVLILGQARITRKDTNAVYSTVKFSPRSTNQLQVRVTRKTTFATGTFQVISNLVLASLITRFDRSPIVTDKRHVFLELKIRATNQLNGSVQNLSAEVSSVLDVYNSGTSTWHKQLTSNPAWVFCDLLTGQSNRRPISKSRLHMPSIVEWANFADQVPTPPSGHSYLAPRFQTNFVLDFEATVQQVLNLVCNAAQASLNISDGKYGVLLDKLRTVPVQVFTPRNTMDFSSIRNYFTPPNALKVKFVEPSANWAVTERIIYDDGFTELTATTFDELDSFACTNEEQAWRFGRYMMAQSKLRQENITITVDFEYLVCTRGDYVQYVQDVMKVGGTAARIKTIVGNIVTIDEGIDTLVGVSYGYVYRNKTDGIQTNTLDVISSDTFQLNLPHVAPAVGDLIIIGEMGFIAIDCIVKAISPQNDFSAQLTLVEKADAIYSAESSGTIPAYSAQISPTQNTEFVAPKEVQNLQVIKNDYRCLGSDYQYYIDLDWDVPSGSAYSLFEIYADTGRGYDLVTYTKDSAYEYIVNQDNLSVVHNFKVIAVSASGKKLDLGAVGFVTATPLKKTSAPTSIDALYLNVTDQTIQLDWKAITDCDVFEYLIRFAPNSNGTWESSIPLLRVDRHTTLAHAQSRTGTYLIKAVDFNGNESLDAAIAITSIPELTGLNFIEETNDFPTLAGNLIQTIKDGDALELQKVVSGDPTVNEYYSEGYYYFADFLDLGEIYTVRLQSLIEAEGFTVDDIMSNWVTLDTVVAMSGAKQSDWDVETQCRATDSFNVMSEWPSMDVIDPLSEGASDNWTPWKKFTIGDFTGRIFEFRLKLISNKASVTPKVFNGIIRSDMPDRFETYNNLSATSSGLAITYTPAFKGPATSPNVQITQDAAQSGDYPVITSKTLNGCFITIYDKNDIAVARSFDVAVKGYGRKASAVI